MEQVAIPSITGLHSYKDGYIIISSKESQSLLLQVFIHTKVCWHVLCTNSCRNPFYYRSSFILPWFGSFFKKEGRNPFYYRSSFIQEVWRGNGCICVAIPSITGLHSYCPPFPFSCIDKYLQNRFFNILGVLKVRLKIFLKCFIV